MTAVVSSKPWATKYPELGTGPLPVEPNISPEYFEREREHIFKRSWLNVGRIDEIPQPGDYFVRDLGILGTSVIIARGKDGVVRGFHNVCRHRGNTLVRACGGRSKSFICGYHGWTYDLAGQLVRVPDEEQFHNLEKSEHALASVATDIWEGLVFINVEPHPAETLREWIGELFDQFTGYPFDAMSRVAGYAARVNANWKVCMDIGEELYHIAFVHRRSIPDSHTGKDNPYSHFRSIRLFRRHRSGTISANPEHKPTPTEALAFKYAPTVLQGTAEGEVLPPGLNPDKIPNWAFDATIIFPNVGILLGNGWYVMHRFWPISVDRTLWESGLYMTKAENAGERISQELSRVLTRDLLREDLGTVESTQKALASGLLTHMQLSDQEIMVRHGYKVVGDFVEPGKDCA